MAEKKSVTIGSGAGAWVFIDKGSNIKSDDSQDKASSSEPSRAVTHHPEFFFDNTLVAIQIENTLFNVHKYQLAKSEVFSDMFKMPKPKGNEPEEGSSPEHPIVMSGIAVSDFTALLKVLYASLFSSNHPVPEAPLIVPAFRLANMLNFSELRVHLLPLAEKNLGDIEKIIFAREFDIKEWLAPAHINLCQRKEPLSTEEARKLELDSVLLILRMRERYQTSGLKLTINNYYCNGCVGLSSGYSAYCGGCGGHSTSCYLCFGPGAMVQKENGSTSSNELEAEVKKWVDDGCVLKNE